MNFTEALDAFICERTEVAFRKLRSENEGYIANNRRLTDLAEKVAECMRDMGPEVKGILEVYNDCRSAQEGDNIYQAYLCGMKDVLQLLELLAAV